MAVAQGLWGVSEGGGENSGIKECIFEVQAVEPGSVKSNQAKKNMIWKGINQFHKPMSKTFGIGADWNFDFSQGKFVDAKGQPDRQVNSSTTFGILLASILGKSRPTEDGGPMIDLSGASADLMQFPQGPLSVVPWVGTRWHMLEVTINFGNQKVKQKDAAGNEVEVEKPILNKMLFPIRYLGRTGTPMPEISWVFGVPAQAPAAPSGFGGYQQFQAPVPAPQSQYQQVPQPQQQYAQPLQPQYQQVQAPSQQYQAPALQAPPAPAYQQYQQVQAPQYAPQPQAQVQMVNQYQQGQVQQPAPGGNPHFGYSQFPGGGPSAAPGFPGQH